MKLATQDLPFLEYCSKYFAVIFVYMVSCFMLWPNEIIMIRHDGALFSLKIIQLLCLTDIKQKNSLELKCNSALLSRSFWKLYRFLFRYSWLFCMTFVTFWESSVKSPIQDRSYSALPVSTGFDLKRIAVLSVVRLTTLYTVHRLLS